MFPEGPITIEPGREVSVLCISEGNYSGMVSWHRLVNNRTTGQYRAEFISNYINSIADEVRIV